MTKIGILALLVACISCAEHPCTEECRRQLSVWQREATAQGSTIPSASVCDDPAIPESKSCAECEAVLQAIADGHGLSATPACDGVTEAS